MQHDLSPVPFSRPQQARIFAASLSDHLARQQMKAALSFTGGKDSVLAMQEAIQQVLDSGWEWGFSNSMFGYLVCTHRFCRLVS